MSKWLMIVSCLLIASMLPGCGQSFSAAGKGRRFIDPETIHKVREQLLAKDSGSRERILKGTEQLALNWQSEDGAREVFYQFCLDNFLSAQELEPDFQHICQRLILLRGSIDRIREKFTESDQYTDVTALKSDPFFREAIPRSAIYKGKLSLFIQLNFPYYTLEEKRASAAHWTREKWAMVRLGDLYVNRGKGPAGTAEDEKVAAFSKYMENYFVRMDHVCMPDGSYPFPGGTSLHSHRGLRDDIKEQYTRPGGQARQKLSGKVIEHIVMGTIPDEFLKDTNSRWDPWSDLLFHYKDNRRVPLEFTPQGTRRYEGMLAAFHKRKMEDSAYNAYMSYNGSAALPGKTMHGKPSTYLKRNFEDQNMLQEEVERLIREFLSNPVIDSAAKLISARLGRPLEPFDIWYSGFQEQAFYPADVLDSIVRKRYPDVRSFQHDLSNILGNMGFPLPEAQYLGEHIRVRPVTSGGYTKRPPFPDDTVIMTTMIGPDGMDYKSYRVAMHELGHAVEMLYTAKGVDNFILADVPSNGITEGIAELLAYKNMNGLGLAGALKESQPHIQALATLWYLVEMGGQALTDMLTWKWLYAHPASTPAELRSAVLRISSEVWNQYYAGLFGIRDQHILSIYNHFICGELYLYNYFISNVVMFQLYAAFGQDLSGGLKSACKEGNTLPDQWMLHAIGEPISIRPLLAASEDALRYFSLHGH